VAKAALYQLAIYVKIDLRSSAALSNSRNGSWFRKNDNT